MASYSQSHRASCAPTLSPSTPPSPLDGDQETSLSASSKAIQSSLESLNVYVQKHYDRFVAHESLERSRLAASFAEKEKSYEKQLATLKAVHTDIAGLLARERTINVELGQKLDDANSSMARLYQLVTDANFVFVEHKRLPHRVKQEESPQENMYLTDVTLCPNAAVSALLSQVETIVDEMNLENGVGLPSPIDSSPCCSIIEALRKVVDSLSATRRTFELLQENYKSAHTARVDAERQNVSLQENFALLQEELKQARRDNERISQELAAARLEKERHVCQVSDPRYPTPDEFPVSLPSPPLEKRDLAIPDDILQDSCDISRKTDQTLAMLVLPENTPSSPEMSVVEVEPSPALASTSCERRKISFRDAVKKVQANPTSSIIQSGPSNPPTVHDDRQTVEPSMPPPPVAVQGIKRTSSGVHKCQNVSKGPPPSLSTSASASSPISDKTNSPHTQKKRRISGTPNTSAVNQKHKPTNTTPSKTAITTHTPMLSSSKHTAMPLPKTNASDLKSLKFNKKSQPSKPHPTPAVATSTNTLGPIVTPAKSMKPLDLAKKSPQERAAMRRLK